MPNGIGSLPIATRTPSPQLAAQRQRQALADAGDLRGLLRALDQAGPTEWQAEFDSALDLMLTRSRQHPEQFATEILDRIGAVASYFLVRSEFRLRQLTRALGEGDRYQPEPYGPSNNGTDGTEPLLDRYLQLARLTTEVLAFRATTARQWALARAKNLETKRLKRIRKAKRDPAHKQKSPKPSPNGHNAHVASSGNNGHTRPPGSNSRFSFQQ